MLADNRTRTGDHQAAFAAYSDRPFGRCRLVVETCVDIAEREQDREPGFDNVAATNHIPEVPSACETSGSVRAHTSRREPLRAPPARAER